MGKGSNLPSWARSGGSAQSNPNLPAWAQTASPSAKPTPAHKSGGGGVFGDLKKAAHWTAKKTELAATDVKNIPGGIYDMVNTEQHLLRKTIAHPNADPNDPRYGVNAGKWGKHANALVHGMEKSTVDTVKHPLRDPFQTALLAGTVFSGGASVAARASEAGRVAGEGATIGDIAKAAVNKPPVKPRFLSKNGEQTPIQPSHNPGVRAAQGLHDKVVQHAIDNRPDSRVAAYGTKRIGGSLDETGRYQARMRSVPAGVLERASSKLNGKLPGHVKTRVEQAALELTSVNTAPEDAAAYHAAQAEKGVEPARNRAVSKLYAKVAERGMLTKNQAGDVIVNAADHPALAKTDLALAKVQGRGDEILTRYGIRSAEDLQAAIDKPGRYRAGATYEKPTPGKAGKSPALDQSAARVARLQKTFDAMADRPTVQEFARPRTVAEAQARLGALEKEHNTALDKVARGMFGNPGANKAEVAFRNNENDRAALQQAGRTRTGNLSGSRGRKSQIRRTVSAEHQALAERTIQDAIDRNPDHPTLKRWQDRVDEIDQLRAALNPDLGEKVDKKALGSESSVRVVANPKRERAGGALSVAKDDLERQQRRVFGYHDNKGVWHPGLVKQTGVVGGEQARPGRGFVSYRGEEAKAPKNAAAQSGGPVVGEAKAPIPSHVNTGANIAKGYVPGDVTGMAARHYQQIIRFQNTSERRAAAIRSGAKTKQTSRDVLAKIPGVSHEKINPVVNEILGKSKLTADDLEGLNAALQAYKEDLVPGLRDKFSQDRHAGIGTPAPEGHVWVDRNVLGDLAKPGAGPRGKIARSFDNVNSAVTAATVYFKIGHVGTRALTNTATAIIQGSAEPTQIARSLKLWHALSDEEKMRALAAAGQHGFQAMPHEGASIASRFAGKGAAFWARRFDSPVRFNSIAYEARKAGFDTPAKFKKMLDQAEDPAGHGLSAAQHAKVDWVLKRANREGIAYDRLSPFERQYIGRALWFYSWLRGTANFAANTALEHPYKAGAFAQAGAQGRDKQARELGDLPSYEKGLLKLGGSADHPLVTDFSTFSPFATPADMLDTAAGLDSAAGFLNPVYSAGVQLGTHQNQYGQHTNSPVTSALASLFAPAPESQIATAYLNRHKNQNRKMFHTTWQSALARALVGPGTPRHLNTHAGHAAAARQRAGR